MTLTLPKINDLSKSDFISAFSGVIEHTEQAALYAEQFRPYSNVDQIVQTFNQYLDLLGIEVKREVLTRYPKLGSKSQMSQHSQDEHKASGIDSLEQDKAALLLNFNIKYTEKFGFPFVICVKENTPDIVLSSIRSRLNNSMEEEIREGIEQVKKIAAIRIKLIVQSSNL